MRKRIVRTVSALGIFSAVTGGALAADIPELKESDIVYSEPRSGILVGMLKCSRQPGFGYVIGSAKNLECVFSSKNDERGIEFYRGQIVKSGIDIGYTGDSVLVWGVLAPTADIERHRLEGTYLGVQAEATVLIGGGLNLLSGSFNNQYNLVPLSVSGNTGLNVAGGIGAITLHSVE